MHPFQNVVVGSKGQRRTRAVRRQIGAALLYVVLQTGCFADRAGTGELPPGVEFDASAQGASIGASGRGGPAWRVPLGEPRAPGMALADSGEPGPSTVGIIGTSPVPSWPAVEAGVVRDPGASDAAASFDGSAAPADTGAANAAGDSGACQGAVALDLCWYLADRGVSCRDHCTAHGGYDLRANALVGTPLQGGSAEACAEVLATLGVSTVVYPATRYDYLGLGCHRWSNGVSYWLSAPDLALFSQDNWASDAELACACAR